MSASQTYLSQLQELRDKVKEFENTHSATQREETAKRLEGLNYAPSMITPTATFLRMDQQGLLEEIDRIVAMDDAEACALAPDDTLKCEDLRLQYIRVLLFYYEKLIRLRNGDAEEWDEVDELYVHD